MTEVKMVETSGDVNQFINNDVIEKRRKDSLALLEIFRSVTGFEPKMWGSTIIGFGKYHYKYATGHEGDAPLAGFSPRKDSLVIYIESEFGKREEVLSKLGKHRASKVCVYANKLEDIDISVLKKLIKASMEDTLKQYPPGKGMS